jgi:hypothetical protein
MARINLETSVSELSNDEKKILWIISRKRGIQGYRPFGILLALHKPDKQGYQNYKSKIDATRQLLPAMESTLKQLNMAGYLDYDPVKHRYKAATKTRRVISYQIITRHTWSEKKLHQAEEKQPENIVDECCICLEENSLVLFQPCRHQCCCVLCGLIIRQEVGKTCPLCRTPVNKILL